MNASRSFKGDLDLARSLSVALPLFSAGIRVLLKPRVVRELSLFEH